MEHIKFRYISVNTLQKGDDDNNNNDLSSLLRLYLQFTIASNINLF
jgi:hypothetical protein